MSQPRPKTSFFWTGVSVLAGLTVILALLIIILLWSPDAIALPARPQTAPRVTRTPTPRVTKTPTPRPILAAAITGLRSAAELATVRYMTVAEVRDEKVPADLRQALGIKEEVSMLIYAEVKAGFDLDQISQNDLRIDGKSVRLVLPPPKILSVVLDQKRTHIVYHKGSAFVETDPNWIQEMYQVGEEAIRREALEAGILDQAAAYGRIYLENYFRQIGFTNVQIRIR